MTTPKRHHYLPEAYLRGFTRGGAADSTFAVYDRKLNALRVQTPRNTAVATHYYTVETASGEKSTHIESGLAELESLAMPVLRKLAAGKPITLEEKQNFAIFVGLLHTRVPQFERGTLEMAEGIYKSTTKRALPTRAALEAQLRRLYPEKDVDAATVDEMFEIFQSGDYDIRFNKGWLRSLMLDTARSAAWGLWQMQWIVYHAPASTSFITTDAPFITLPPRHASGTFRHMYGIGTPGAIKVVPLTHMACLCIGDRGLAVQHADGPRNEVRTLNVEITRRAERIVIGRDADLVRSIVAKAQIAGTERGPIARVF